MNKLVQGMLTKNTLTENGMPTHSTSTSACLDWFAGVGASRNWSEDQILGVFTKALAEDALVALRILFWARDVREGAGERRVFRVCIEYMNSTPSLRSTLERNLHLVSEYGRWDDIFSIDNKMVLELIEYGLNQSDGLLAKWLPRKGLFANKVRQYLGLTPKAYRKLIVGLSNTVEQVMCNKEWEAINYEQVPSVAMHKYRKAFARNDNARFVNFIEKVQKGEATIKSGVLFPYQLYQAYKRREDANAIEAQWMNLPNFMEGNDKMVLPICDTSGSMTSGYGLNTDLTPMDISVSLGIYISERNEGPFKDCFMTFSHNPQLQRLEGSFTSRCRQLETANWSMNTDLEAAFRLLLRAAVTNNVSEDEMPDTLLILSDMQFDSCVSKLTNTALEMIRDRYEKAGYKVPNVSFWNINARVGKMPVQVNDMGVSIISGCSPSILKSVLSGKVMDPITVMLNTVMAERYQKITI